ncbi:hypothetical protein [Lysinibacillus sphaericus]|nr:hypothetical protein [Lysinibacillus sphaericus]
MRVIGGNGTKQQIKKDDQKGTFEDVAGLEELKRSSIFALLAHFSI